MRLRILWLCLLAPCVASLGACAGSGQGLDANGRPPGSGSGGGQLTATFQSIQDDVFTPICSVCHAGGAAPQGLRLDAANSYAMIVGVPSAEVSSLLRIKPGDPDNSYLVQKIEGHAAVGAQMPFGGPPLPAATIAVIRQWVTDGALQAVAATQPHVFAVTSVAPAAGEVVLGAPAPIVIGFSGELDATRADASSVRLERITTSERGSVADDVPVSVAIPAGNPAALLVAPRQRLADGRYRLFVTGAPGAGLSDVGGARLSTSGRDVLVTDFAVEATP
jgi:methionine-rich copper-binding protein CopC